MVDLPLVVVERGGSAQGFRCPTTNEIGCTWRALSTAGSEVVHCSDSWIHDRYGRLQEIETIVAEKEPGAFLRSLPCVVGLPAERKPVDTRIVECELTHKQRDIYDKLQYELISEVEGGLLVASIPLVKLLRLRQ